MTKTHLFSIALCAGTFAFAGALVSQGFSEEKPKSVAEEKEVNDPKLVAAKIESALSKLPKSDRTLADAQRYCPMMDKTRLGAMGTPVKVMIDGKAIFLCCAGCEEGANSDGKKTLANVEKLKKSAAALAKLPATDLPIAEAQLFCPIHAGSRLGSMGVPVKVTLDGKPVFLCCKGCEAAARKDPKGTLAKVSEIKEANSKSGHDEH